VDVGQKTLGERGGVLRSETGASGQIGWSVPRNRQIGGAFTPR
jgi:hypothetical protein